VAALLAPRAHAQGLEQTVSIEPEVPLVAQGDPFRLRQVLTNLLGNAIKFTASGEVGIHVQTISSSDAATEIRFAVRDTGIGLSPAQQAGLFQAFAQADASTTRRYGGTGLGLAISQRLVSLLGGKIGVESALGEGSTFWFTATLAPSSAAAVVSPAHATSVAMRGRSLRAKRVLVVDDNATNRKLVDHQLRVWGLHPDVAADGPTALALLREAATQGTPYDLALLDMQMPDMDGLELGREITADPALCRTRLILLTSLGGGDSAANREAGILVTLTKPVRQTQLYDAVTTVVNASDGAPIEAVPSPSAQTPLAEGHAEIDWPLVLLAEDNAVNQRVAQRTLEKLGYRVALVADGQAAVAAVGSTTYAAVLMDCQMPLLDGYGAAAAIRLQEGAARRTPIIAMTAHALRGDRERCLAAGMDDYLAKPMRAEELAAMLRRWVPPVAALATPAPGSGSSEGTGGTGGGAAVDLRLLARLRDLAGDEGTDIVLEVATVFLEDAPLRLVAMREALDQGDSERLLRETHTLKGSAASMGASPMARLCAEMEALGSGNGTEALGNSNGLEAGAAVLSRLDAELSDVRAALNAYLAPK
jgi:CheY-like chemotaxis protein/HPt (histidine-containing phosphotransfer) domain-containing protein